MISLRDTVYAYLSKKLNLSEIELAPLVEKHPQHQSEIISRLVDFQQKLDAIDWKNGRFRHGTDHTHQTVGFLKIVSRVSHDAYQDLYIAQHLLMDKKRFFVTVFEPHYFEQRLKWREKPEVAVVRKLKQRGLYTLVDYNTERGDPTSISRFLNLVPLASILKLSEKLGRAPSLKQIDGLFWGSLDWLNPHIKLRYKNYNDFVCQLIIKICNAVGKIHDNGLIHGRLNMNNIFINELGDPVIMQIGMPKTARINPENVTLDDLFLAPEQLNTPENQITQAVDTYAISMIFYTLLTGKFPYYGTDYRAIMFQSKTEQPLPAKKFCEAMAVELDTLIQTGLQRQKELRPANLNMLRLGIIDSLHQAEQNEDNKFVLQEKKFIARHPVLSGMIMLFLVSYVVSTLAVRYPIYQLTKSDGDGKSNASLDTGDSDKKGKNGGASVMLEPGGQKPSEADAVTAENIAYRFVLHSKRHWTAFNYFFGACMSVLLVMYGVNWLIRKRSMG